MSRIRILPTVSALILTFAVLFGGYQVYKNYELIKPLQEQLSGIHQVLSARIVAGADVPTVVIQLGPVADLQQTYGAIENDVTNALGSPVAIVLKDRRTPKLAGLFEGMGLTGYQGIAQGDYLGMSRQMTALAHKAGASSRVTMNGQDIFVTLTQGSAYLYAIVPYAGKSVGVTDQ